MVTLIRIPRFIMVFFIMGFHSRAAEAVVGGGDNTGLILTQPEECTSRECTLSLGVVSYEGPHLAFETRAYNGNIPGPTIRVAAGEQFNITLVNQLQDVNNIDYGPNEYRYPNSSNLHTHGLHTSSRSPGDNVYVKVDPGSVEKYSYSLLPHHTVSYPSFHVVFVDK